MRIVFLLICIALSRLSIAQTKASNPQAPCKPFFQFDEVVHYKMDTSKEELINREGGIDPGIIDAGVEYVPKTPLSSDDSLLVNLVLEGELDAMADTLLIAVFEQIGFVKSQVPGAKVALMKDIFCQRKHYGILSHNCGPIYRDILVFKKNERIVATAKLCFSCGDSLFAGSNAKTVFFGQDDEFETLFPLLYDRPRRIGRE